MSDVTDRLLAFAYLVTARAPDLSPYVLQETLHDAVAEIRQLRADLKAARALTARVRRSRPRAAWHEDIGPVLWHHLDRYGRFCEAPIVAGDPENVEFWAGYFTHWTLLPDLPEYGDRTLQVAPRGDLVCDLEGLCDA